MQATVILAKLPYYANKIKICQVVAEQYAQLIATICTKIKPPIIKSYNSSVYAQLD